MELEKQLYRLSPEREKLSQFSTIIFDMDGTIILDKFNPSNTDFPDSSAYAQIEKNAVRLICSSLQWTHEAASAHVQEIKQQHKSLRRTVCDMLRITQADYFQQVWNIDPGEHVILRPYVMNVLNQFRNDGKLLVLVTKAPSIWQQKVLEHFAITHFHGIFTGDISDDKSLVFEKISRSITPDSILSIGDSFTHDIEPALKLGMNALHLTEPTSLEVLLR